ncbi:MAG: hypothetical protein R6W97_12130 [Thiobacillus sp.]
MRPRSQLLVSLAGLAAVLLISESATSQSVPDARIPPSQQIACTASTPNVPAEYWFYHALAASHPSLLDPRSDSAPCPARKVIRT